MNVNGLGQVRVTQMNGSSRKRCSSCVDEEVCANPVRSKRKNLKKLLTRSASLEIRRYGCGEIFLCYRCDGVFCHCNSDETTFAKRSRLMSTKIARLDCVDRSF